MEGVGRGIPPTRPGQFRIANCFCFLDLRARTPPGGYLGPLSPSFARRTLLDGVRLKNVSLIGITCQLKRGGRGGTMSDGAPAPLDR